MTGAAFFTEGRLGEMRIPVAPVQRAIEDSGVTLSEVCQRLGWEDRNGQADVTRLRRRLGLVRSITHEGGRTREHRAETIEEGVAADIIRAVHALPRDYGL